MQNTWPVSNKKFEEHVVDPQAHDARFNAIEADYEAQIESEEIRASRVESEIEARSLNRYKDACGRITTVQTRAESVETGLSERITSEVGTLRADHNQLSDTVDGLQNLPHVIECGSNKYGSYRKWSNGDIEQWGTGYADGNVRMLPVAFPNTNYMVLVTPQHFGYGYSFGTKKRTTSTFVICSGYACEGHDVEKNNADPVFWYARSL